MAATSSEVLTTWNAEYFERFVGAGGSTTKVVVAEKAARTTFVADLRAVSQDANFRFAFVSADNVRVHLIQYLFFEISRQIDWQREAHGFVKSLLLKNELCVPDMDLSLESIAEANGIGRPLMENRMHQLFSRHILRRPGFSPEFRRAVLQLVNAVIQPKSPAGINAQYVVEWLNGTIQQMSFLRPSDIFRKINRRNARHLLVGTAAFLRDAGARGLTLAVDLSRYAENSRATNGTLNHSPAASLDAYEVVREFIDAAEDIEGCFSVFLQGTDFLMQGRRGIDAYAALKMRLVADVFDQNRPNLLASMLTLGQLT